MLTTATVSRKHVDMYADVTGGVFDISWEIISIRI